MPDATPAEIIKALERHYVTAISVAGGVVTAGPDQAKALVYGLSNSRVSQAQVTSFATDLAKVSPSSSVDMGRRIADGRGDWSHWASTRAGSLPGDGAKSLVQSIQVGQLEDVRGRLGGRKQTAVEFGVGAALGSASRFAFGREVVVAARGAFPSGPETLPDHLAVEVKEKPDTGDEPNRALLALTGAAQATGGWVGGAATSVGSGVTTAASAVSRPFRSVDRDGDGIPDDPQALTAAKASSTGPSTLERGSPGSCGRGRAVTTRMATTTSATR